MRHVAACADAARRLRHRHPAASGARRVEHAGHLAAADRRRRAGGLAGSAPGAAPATGGARAYYAQCGVHPQRGQRDPQPVPAPAESRSGDVRLSAPGRQRAGAGPRLQHGVPVLPAGAVRAAGRTAGGSLMRWRRAADTQARDEAQDAWSRHVAALASAGIGAPEMTERRCPATQTDHEALYAVGPSFVDRLPWVEYLPESQSMLLEDGQSVAAFFELQPIGTEGRELAWLWQARDALENALQDAFDELDENPWVLQFYAQDET